MLILAYLTTGNQLALVALSEGVLMAKFPTLPLAIRDLFQVFFSAHSINLLIDFWGQEQLSISGDTPDHPLKLRIHHPGVVRALILQRDPLVLTDAYLKGFLDLDSPLEDAIPLATCLGNPVSHWHKALWAWVSALGLPRLSTLSYPLEASGFKEENPDSHSPAHDQQAIHYHYDIGNDFYRLWLDPMMVYSCARFEQDTTSLNEAQATKLDRICRKLRLEHGNTFLDIGCGWGSLLRWAATHYGVKAYGITLSEEQLRFCQKCIADEGLDSRVHVQLLDYRSLSSPAGEGCDRQQFDKIASVGMIEHVGPSHYPIYFRQVLSALKPGGLFLNHGITSSRVWNRSAMSERFMNRYIFPQGHLARLSDTLVAAENEGWEIVDVDAWRPHYAATLRHWASNLDQAQDQGASKLGERRLQLWRLYLLLSALNFDRSHLNLYQILLRRRSDANWNLPLTREGWLC